MALSFKETSCQDFLLLGSCQFDEIYGVAGDSDGELGVFFGVVDGFLEEFAVEDVDVEVMGFLGEVAVEDLG